MTLTNLKAIEYTKKSNFSLPNPPVISSDRSGWEKLHLAMYRQPACYIPEYSSPYHIICVNTGNPVTLERTIEGRSPTIEAIQVGDVGIYPARVHQSCFSPQDIELIRLYLEPTLLTQIQAELCLDREVDLALQLTPSFDPLIYQMAIALKNSLEIDGTSSKLYAGAMANALAVHLLSRYSTRTPFLLQPSGGLSEKQLKQVVDYIHEYLNRDVSLTELANLVQLSSYHFTRLFKRAIGFAPHQYHIRCRIDRVKQLLLEKKLSLAEIAYAVGFASQGHLNYHFKRIVGMTPTAFLRHG
ncbi:MAG: helix-turn-helix transcriptional regulator [Microcoleus sp. PH2017_10_PVI_O_A]|uniref:helix-turn-helix domain-containing protein n=1 Tax=unclassified Microcoleus TaxID=2642155 RepID=UPI001D666DE3|nr:MULTISPECIES: AraC family transcriptional regulator [unclassified Microcoleus]MCC3409144.1 helix-turn-helix transcriptional regulator [Microcoleus sp. PH2017_10_PVI_O_A]MCC3463291.1 helix-turn-helix transcriptional regulator [Microcoleus sp. PH2017_11_PCY_U_A]MCC3481701.1 helix-turn-helix transcriptional regulator [Microcoleus sp. PH2017_12_PCY_D_A]MCC3526596.1 helix-turn-helix transcriptional regulator [Microcoleus sp. PH2017_21_RUC_O_A]MCC3538939.1 helix-turn-helix transcriptional regulat